MPALLSVPDAWVTSPSPSETQRTEARAFFESKSQGILRVIPDLPELLAEIACAVGIEWKLLACRIELEQGAVSYTWDGSNPVASYTDPALVASVMARWPDGASYARMGITTSDLMRLAFLTGTDKPGRQPRPDGWFGPELQLAGCAVRFKYLYRGSPISAGGLALPALPSALAGGLAPSPDVRSADAPQGFRPGAPVTRNGQTIVPANQASADALRYTASMDAQHRLREIGRGWFPADYAAEEGADMAAEIKPIRNIVIDPGHGSRGDTGTAGGGVLEQVVTLKVGLALEKILLALGHTVHLSRRTKLSTSYTVTERGVWAASKKANVFVSIHFDGNNNTGFRGCHGFYHRETATKGKALATALAQAVSKETGFPFSYRGPASTWDNDGDGVPNSLGVLSGGNNWLVTDAAALIECGTMTNPDECAVILRDDFPARCALALARGIYAYADLPFPEQKAQQALDGAYKPGAPPDPQPPQPERPSALEEEIKALAAALKENGVTDAENLEEPLLRWMGVLLLGRYDLRRVAPLEQALRQAQDLTASLQAKFAALEAETKALAERPAPWWAWFVRR